MESTSRHPWPAATIRGPSATTLDDYPWPTLQKREEGWAREKALWINLSGNVCFTICNYGPDVCVWTVNVTDNAEHYVEFGALDGGLYTLSVDGVAAAVNFGYPRCREGNWTIDPRAELFQNQ